MIPPDLVTENLRSARKVRAQVAGHFLRGLWADGPTRFIAPRAAYTRLPAAASARLLVVATTALPKR